MGNRDSPVSDDTGVVVLPRSGGAGVGFRVVDDGADGAADAVFVLEPGVPYPRRWAQAQDAVVMLRGELVRVGLTELADRVRAQVNTAGVGVVELGSVSPHTARALAELLAVVAAGAQARVAAAPGPGPRVP